LREARNTQSAWNKKKGKTLVKKKKRGPEGRNCRAGPKILADEEQKSRLGRRNE